MICICFGGDFYRLPSPVEKPKPIRLGKGKLSPALWRSTFVTTDGTTIFFDCDVAHGLHDNSDTFSDQVYAVAATFMAVTATMILTARTAVIFLASLVVLPQKLDPGLKSRLDFTL